MKKFYHLALIALVAFAFCSCDPFNKPTPEFQLSDLQGLWLETNVKDSQHYVRFTTEQSEEAPYLLGLEWDEAEGIYESDLWEAREKVGIPGNGWFKYWMKKTNEDNELTEIHLMDNGGAEIPKVYVVTALSETKLAYYEKERPSDKYTFEKQVESKE